jgi:hypothetical protein
MIETSMRLMGFFLLVMGWLLIAAAVALLGAVPMLPAFVLAGCGVEALGLYFVVRSHLIPSGGHH